MASLDFIREELGVTDLEINKGENDTPGDTSFSNYVKTELEATARPGLLERKGEMWAPRALEAAAREVTAIPAYALGIPLAPGAAGAYAALSKMDYEFVDEATGQPKKESHPYNVFKYTPTGFLVAAIDPRTEIDFKNIEQAQETQAKVEHFMHEKAPVLAPLLKFTEKSLIARGINFLWTKVDNFARNLGDSVFEKTGNAALATEATVAIQGALMLTAPKAAKTARNTVSRLTRTVKMKRERKDIIELTDRVNENIIELTELVRENPQYAGAWSEFFNKYGIQKDRSSTSNRWREFLEETPNIFERRRAAEIEARKELARPREVTYGRREVPLEYAEAPDIVPRARIEPEIIKRPPALIEKTYGGRERPFSYAEGPDMIPKARLSSLSEITDVTHPKAAARIVDTQLTEPTVIFRRPTKIKARQPVSPERLLEELEMRRAPTITTDFMGLQQLWEGVAKFVRDFREVGRVDKENARLWSKYIDVESPFVKLKSPNTGFHTKNYHSVVSAFQDYGVFRVGENVKKFGGRHELAPEVVLAATDPAYYKALPTHTRALIRPAVQDLLSFMAMGKNLMKTHGLPVDFKARIISEIRRKYRTATPEERTQLSESLEVARRMNFTHIPTAIWFQTLAKTAPRKISMLRSLVAKERKTLTINELVNKGIVPKTMIHPGDIIGSYAMRLGKDIAALRIRAAAKNEGLLTTKYKSGYHKVDSMRHPLFKKLYAHPHLLDMMESHLSFTPREYLGTLARRAFATTKMFQFTQPWFLWFYDMRQQLAAVGIRGLKDMPTYWRKAWNGSRHRTKDLYEAYDMGSFSQPYSNALDTYQKAINRAKLVTEPAYKKFATRFKRESIPRTIAGLPKESISTVYTALWDLAWEGDRMIRLATYLYLRDKKKIPRFEAGQLTARFHADYASVPANIREKLNLPFFTPTFKVAMGKLYLDSVRAAVNTATLRLPKQKTYRGNPKAQRQLALGLSHIVGTMVAMDILMEQLGYDREWFGYKYKKVVSTPEGDREFVMTFSEPFNLINKYSYRVHQSFEDPTQPTAKRFLQFMKYELHPLLRSSYNAAITGKDDQGRRIYYPLDDTFTKYCKGANYLTKSLLRAYGDVTYLLGEGEPTRTDKLARGVSKEEFGVVGDAIMRQFIHTYTRNVKDRRLNYRMRQLMKVYRNSLIEAAKEEVNPSPVWERNFRRYMEEVSEEIY